MALDEELKARVMAMPELAWIAQKISRRYLAGPDIESAVGQVFQISARGHRSSIECVGESIRDRYSAEQETLVFLEIARRLESTGTSTTISLDLSHLGSLIDPELGFANALRVAQAARDAGTYLMISAESAERTDLVLGTWERMIRDFPETGITVQARLHRTPDDLARLLRCEGGPVRLVKGAFQEAVSVATPRNDPKTTARYKLLAQELLRSGRRVNFATHDVRLLNWLQPEVDAAPNGDSVEFEMLQGLGTRQLNALHSAGYNTREYAVFGPEFWLYVLNRMAEEPERVLLALADIQGT
ncbi:proline dehydrogenase family protein [Glutamicibacter sp.]|uniref:proline dehydrogenase family protein n=1 Tax=Glutamicibacter sp. TaxID=1931995 RepID=UPI003D6BC777